MTNKDLCLVNLGEAIKKAGWVLTALAAGRTVEAFEDAEAAMEAMVSVYSHLQKEVDDLAVFNEETTLVAVDAFD